MDRPDIFDRKARAGKKLRAQRAPAPDRWLNARMLEELAARAADMGVHAGKALFFGDNGGQDPATLFSPAVTWQLHDGEEDRFDPGTERFDLIVANGSLDSVNDLPGALIQIRRALTPSGLFLGAFMGAGSLERLRSIVTHSQYSEGKARFHPQIDVRAAGDLLARAGFREPVADTETIDTSYRDLIRLVGDVRANGLSNILPQTIPVTRIELASWLSAFVDEADADGRVIEKFCPVYLTGRSPMAQEQFRRA